MLPLAAWITYKDGQTSSFYFLLAAAILYAVGVFGITIGGNVPLNNMLDKFDIAQASADAIQDVRQKFEAKCNYLQHARTYAAILSFIVSVISLKT